MGIHTKKLLWLLLIVAVPKNVYSQTPLAEQPTNTEARAHQIFPPSWQQHRGLILLTGTGLLIAPAQSSTSSVHLYGAPLFVGAGYHFPEDCLPAFKICIHGQAFGRATGNAFQGTWMASGHTKLAFFINQHRVAVTSGVGLGVGSVLSNIVDGRALTQKIDFLGSGSLGLLGRLTPTLDLTLEAEVWTPTTQFLSSAGWYNVLVGTQLHL